MKTTRPILVGLALAMPMTTASASAAPDLRPVNATLDRARAAVGETIAVSCDVVNNDIPATPSRLKYYFSADASFDAGDKYLNYDDVGALGTGGQEHETANVKVPAGTVDGNYHVLVIADFDGAVPETDEANNVVALPIAVGQPVAGAGPDLALANARLAAAQVDAGALVSAEVDVLNSGTSDAAITQLNYYLSSDAVFGPEDTYLNYDKVDLLSASGVSPEQANVRVPAGTPDGLYRILFVADAKSTLVEGREDNNVAAVQLVVGSYVPRADLSLEAVSVAKSSVQAGDTVSVSATVRSAGDIGAGITMLKYFLSADTTFDAGDKQITYDKVDALAVGATGVETADLRITAATAAGAWNLLFVADADAVETERREDNNVVAVPIVVVNDQPTANLPDLVLVNAALTSASAPAGGSVTASVTVRNDGPVAATTSRLKYFLSTDAVYDTADAYLNYDNIVALAPGQAVAESGNLSIPSLPNGSYHILFVADHTREVAERFESNNVVALPFSIGAGGSTGGDTGGDGADLMVVDAALDSTIVNAGARASLRLGVENVGNQPSAASKVKYYLSRDETYDAGDPYMGLDSVPALAPGASSAEDVNPLIPATTAWGTWYLLAVADAVGEVTESFESNNVVAVAFQVIVDNPTADAADLRVSAPEASKAVVGAGFKVAIDATVENHGTEPAISSRLKIYLSEDAQLGPTDAYLDYRQLDDLEVDAEIDIHASVRIPHETAAGAHHLLVVLDVNREVTETFESNNVVALAITVGADEGPAPLFPYVCPEEIWTDAEILAHGGTVATANTLHLGWDNGKDMTALACVLSHFDVVGLLEVDNAEGLAALESELEAVTGETWSTHISEHAVGDENGSEFYGFAWRDSSASMTGAEGFWTDPNDTVKREPYGASFQMGAFDFTLVIFHLQYGHNLTTRRAEAAHLIDIYDHFQAQNGSDDDVLIGGDFNLPGNDSAFGIVGHDGVDYITDPEQKTSIGLDGLASSFDNIFYSTEHTAEKVASGALDFSRGNYPVVRETVSDHIPVWMAVDTSSDDD